jgi:hypothetical protein
MAGESEASSGPPGPKSAIRNRVITYASRSVELLMRAIRGVEDFEELGRLRAVVWEFHAGNALVFGDLMGEIEARTAQLSALLEQRELFGADAG